MPNQNTIRTSPSTRVFRAGIVAAAFILLLLNGCGGGSRASHPTPQVASAPEKTAASEKPATEKPLENVRVLTGLERPALIQVMRRWKRDLGVECSNCHVRENFPSDEIPDKLTARKMVAMNQTINSQLGFPLVSCWTCHRGEREPAHLPAAVADEINPALAAKIIGLTVEQAQQPATEVFKNIQILKTVPAGRIPIAMSFMSRSLGVKCSFCHDELNWSKDGPDKETARKMLTMVSSTKEFFGGENTLVGCWTCHRGQPKPENPPAMAQGPSVPAKKTP